MNTQINIQERLRLHDRDVALFGRLFADWSRDRERRNAEAHQRLDSIEAQLVRLERGIRMAVPPLEPACMVSLRAGGCRTAISLAVQQS